MSERLRVIAWLWRQHGGAVTYGPEHVRIWAAMLRRHLTLDHSIAVVTDVPGDYGDIEVIRPPGDFVDARIPSWGSERPQCFRRLAMFRPDAAGIFSCDRLVCMDLDVAIAGNIDGILDVAADFKITRGTDRSRAYNGSMMSLRLGSRPQVFEQFTPERAVRAGRAHIGSDQAWIAHVLPGEAIWGPADGVSFWNQHRHGADTRMMFYAGGIKPWDLVMAGERFAAQHYRGDRKGRCLILGYASKVWSEARAATGPFEMVIASPEATEHRNSSGWEWGNVDMVANTDDHALALARMHGFSPHNVVFCGRQLKRSAA